MQSARGSRFPSRVPERFVGCFGLLGPLMGPQLFDIVQERKRNAGGGVLAARRKTSKETLKRSRFEKPKLRSLPERAGVEHVWLLVNLRSDQIRWIHRVEHSVSNLRV
jgi:hypothetical protein